MNMLELIKENLIKLQAEKNAHLFTTVGSNSFNFKKYKTKESLEKKNFIIVDKAKDGYNFFSFELGKINLGTNNYISIEKGSELESIFKEIIPQFLEKTVETIDPISGREIISNIIFSGFVGYNSNYYNRYGISYLIRYLNSLNLNNPTIFTIDETKFFFVPGFSEILLKNGILALSER